jgi:RNA polymerase sigma factor (sigma-70 family)
MMTTRMMTEPAELLDADLVIRSLAGDRDAFGRIVSRYQSLICSLAYSATGSLGQSEDLAQETFITAWKHLGHLREQHKLRSWLCGIARNRINNSLRREGREPSHHAESLDAAAEAPASEPLPPDLAISKEEEAILWRSLERIPEIYREPLILFYREQQSIQRVAEELELSEDTVRQRLSRGRKLLHEQVVAFVEGALTRTNPGKAFTIGVLAALPGLTLSAKAAVVGATAAKGATAKAAGAMGLTGALLSGFMVIFGNYLSYRMSMDSARSDREREFVRSFFRRLIACIVGFSVAFVAVLSLPRQPEAHWFVGLIIGLAAAYLIATVALSLWSIRARRKLFSEMATSGSVVAEAPPVWEYRSKLTLLGLPFIHVRIGGIAARLKPVKAWIAVGDYAIGVLFAFGGIAIAPLSLGGFAIGLLPFGGCAVGVLAVGGFSFGAWSFGGLALGWQALGGCAIAWSAAYGGAAIAHDFALGGIAYALQSNNEIAAQFIHSNLFFKYGEVTLRYFAWVNLLWFVPMLLWWRVVKRRTSKAGYAVS